MPSRKHHLMTDPPGTSWCGELSGYPLTKDPSDYHRNDNGVDCGLTKTILFPDYWCPKCEAMCSGPLKVAYPCIYDSGPNCLPGETISA